MHARIVFRKAGKRKPVKNQCRLTTKERKNQALTSNTYGFLIFLVMA